MPGSLPFSSLPLPSPLLPSLLLPSFLLFSSHPSTLPLSFPPSLRQGDGDPASRKTKVNKTKTWDFVVANTKIQALGSLGSRRIKSVKPEVEGSNGCVRFCSKVNK